MKLRKNEGCMEEKVKTGTGTEVISEHRGIAPELDEKEDYFYGR